MGEKLKPNDWTELIQPAGPDWSQRRINSPVVKVSYEDGSFGWYCVIGALVEKGGDKIVLGLENEINKDGVHSCILGDIPLEELRSGEIEVSGQKRIIEFDGLASDEKHKDKRWSYWF